MKAGDRVKVIATKMSWQKKYINKKGRIAALLTSNVVVFSRQLYSVSMDKNWLTRLVSKCNRKPEPFYEDELEVIEK